MKKTKFSFLTTLLFSSLLVIAEENYFATKMIDFLPAPGQFVSESCSKPNTDYALGSNGTMVSLGGFGGYIVLGFDRPIVNDPKNPYGVDFSINGNSFASNIYGVWTEPGAVQVMKDLNHNGIPDDGEWYELAGSDYYLNTTKKNITMTYYNPKYNVRATMPWVIKDKNGKILSEGAMRTNPFHSHSYFPADAGFDCNYDSVSYKGNIIKGCIDLSSPGYIENYRIQLFGYADNKGTRNISTPRNPYSKQLEGNNSCDGFDLDWAVDANGNYVALDTVHFIRIYTSLNQDGGWLGELSTEITTVGITKPDTISWADSVYYAHYIGIPALKAVVGHPIQYQGILFKNGRPSNEGTPQWTLSSDSCGTIDATGLFYPTKCGEIYVRFKQTDKAAVDSVRLRVVELTGVTLEMEGNSSSVSNDSTSCFVGERIFINAQSTDNISEVLNTTTANRYWYDTYTWTSSNAEIGTIENGLFHALKVGKTMLYAHSKTNINLCDSIQITVKAIPVITPINNPVKVSYYTPNVTLKNNELWNAEGSNATVIMNSVTSKNGLSIDSIVNNVLYCNFTDKHYGIDTLTFSLTVFGQSSAISLPVTYIADNYETDKKLLFVNGGLFGSSQKTTLKSYDIAAKTTSTVGTMNATSVQDLQVDGAFAYISAENYIYRYNISNNELQTSKYVQDTTQTDDETGNSGYGMNSKMAVYQNMLLVTRQNSTYAPQDGYNVRAYNKTDLSLIRKIEVSNQASDIAIIKNKAYVLINGGFNGTTSSMAIINLSDLTLEKEVALGTSGLNINTLIAKDTLIYGIRRNNYIVGSSVMVYNTKSDSFTETATGFNPSWSSGPAVIAPMTGDSLLLDNGNGYSVYDTKKKTISSEKLMSSPDGQFPMAAIYDMEDNVYYATYGDWAGNSSGSIYNSAFINTGSIPGTGAMPEAMALSRPLSINEAPKVKNSTIKSSQIYERATTASYINIAKSNFSDKENNIMGVYFKNWGTYAEWLTPDTTYTLGVRLKAQFTGTLDADSVVYLNAECIDSLGASSEYQAYKITIKPRIYGIFANTIDNITVAKNSGSIQIKLSDVFTYKKTTNVTYTKTVETNTNEDLVKTVIENDILTLSFTTDSIGEARITVRQTGTHNTAAYGSKYAETSFNVIVKETLSGLNKIVPNAVCSVYPNPFCDYLIVNVDKNAELRLCDMYGRCVINRLVFKGSNTISTSQLPQGIYLLHCGTQTLKLIK